MLVDAYRELNARKLFWITMGLNVLVVVVFASLGINEKGPSFWHWTFDNPLFNTERVSPELFYKFQFVTWGTPIWLSWVATILALISTAGIVPDLVTGGTIETMISKPISRLRLFLTKYIFGLLFATAQVLVFSLGCFLVMWIRGGTLEFGLFMAIPIVILFFSYLFAVCALFGLITRSTVASLLLTLVVWFLIFAVNTTDTLVLAQKVDTDLRVERFTRKFEKETESADTRLAQIEASGEKVEDNEGNEIVALEDRQNAAVPWLKTTRTNLEAAKEAQKTWTMWTGRVVLLKTLLPKTQETIALLDRYLVTQEEIVKIMSQQSGIEIDEDAQPRNGPPGADPLVQARLTEELRSRDATWIIGTSLIFEAVVLGLCCLIFVRRDF